MISLKKHSARIKNGLHALASLSFTIWLVGFFGYHLGGWFFSFLAFALVTALLLLRQNKKTTSASPIKPR